MTETMRTFKVFVSSPGDVMVERRRVESVVSRLNGEFAGVARLEAIRWETEFYQAYSTFQAQIPRSVDCDLVIGILRWRLGTELPPDFAEKLPDDKPFPSGTAYEILTAIEQRQKGGKLPDVYVFRFASGSPPVPLDDPNRATIERNWLALKAFFEEWFLTAGGHFKAAFNQYDSEDDFEAQLERLLRKWVADKVTGGRVVRWPIEIKGSPFCGLSAFGAKHAPVFFGRSDDTARAVDLWREAGIRGAPYLLVVGASGSGKSSLARAGLLPRLTTPGVIKDVDTWRVAVMRPGDGTQGPFAALAASLMQNEAALPEEEESRGPALPEIAQGDSQTPAELAAVLLHTDAAAAKPIVNALSRVGVSEKDRDRYSREVRCDLVLLIDQFEELFAASVSDAQRNAFIDLLATLVGTSRIWVVATLRADLYARMLVQPTLKKLKELGAAYDLTPPGPAALAEIVRGPAEAAGLLFETDATTGERLDAQLLTEADRPDMLPLVQLALSRLFEGRQIVDGQTVLPIDVYQSLGGLKGIVNEAGENALASLGEIEKDRLPRLLRQLAVPAHDQDGISKAALTIRAVPLSQVAPDGDEASRKLVAALIEARLLTTTGTPADAQVRLSHQRVLEDWSRARTIVVESTDFYRIRADVEQQRQKWDAAKRSSEFLIRRGRPLAEAESIVRRFPDEIRPETRDFINRSGRRARLAQTLTAVAAVVFAVVAGAAVYAEQAASHAQKEARAQTQIADAQRGRAEQSKSEADAQRDRALRARSNALAAVADQHIDDGDVVTGTLLAMEAADQQTTPEVEAALINGRLHLRELAILPTESYEVHAVAFSADSRSLVTANSNNAQIWDTKTGKRLAVLTGHTATINDARFSRDGKLLATAADDGTARLWNPQTGKLIRVLQGHNAAVTSVAFNADGTEVVTGSQDKTARLWDTTSGKTTVILDAGEPVSSVLFSPDGRLLLTAADGGTARIWDTATGTRVSQFSGHNGEIRWGGAFSPDGTRMVTTSADGTPTVWETATGKPIVALKGHASMVFSVAYIPGTEHILTASYDQTARIWDAKTGTSIAVLAGHSGAVMSAEPSADGRFIVTASSDRTARIWDAETGRPVATLAGHTRWVMQAKFSPDGRRIVTAAQDRTARLWADDAITIKTDHAAKFRQVWRAAIAPDGSHIAAPSKGATARVWDARTGELKADLIGHTASVNAVAFAPNGRRVATASDDTTARVWDAATGKPLLVLSTGNAVSSLAFSPDGERLITASSDNVMRIWAVKSGKLLTALTGHTGGIAKVAFSPDGRLIVSASPFDRTVRLWDAETGKAARPGIISNDAVWAAAFSPDGRRIVTTSLDVEIFDSKSGNKITSFPGLSERITDVVYSSDGRYLLLASLDGTARIWDAENGREAAVVTGASGSGVWTAAASADGSRLLIAFGAQALRIMPMALKANKLVADLRAAVPRCLAPAERVIFNLSAAPPEWCFAGAKWPYQSQAWKLWHQHKDDAQKPPQPEDALAWYQWVIKRGSDLFAKRPAEAITFLREAASVNEELARSNPDNPRWRIEYALDLIDIARALKTLGKLDEARSALDAPTAIIAAAVTASPGNVDRQQYLALIYEINADILLAQNKRTDGLASYARALAIREKLASAKPEDVSRLSNLASDQEKLEEGFLAGSNLSEAARAARSDLASRQTIVLAQPDNAGQQENVAYALRLLGDVLVAEGKAPDAIATYRQSIAIRQKLATAQPDDRDRQSALAYVEERLAEALESGGNNSNVVEAIVVLQQALVLRRRLTTLEPDKAQRQKDVSSDDAELAEVFDAKGQYPSALKAYQDAVGARERAAALIEKDEAVAKGKPGEATAEALASLAWVALFAREFDQSVVASRRAVELAPGTLWIETNLAHGLMFLDRTEEARAIYLKYRDRKNVQGAKSWPAVVLEDFTKLRKAKLTKPLMGEIEKLFESAG